MVQQLFNEVERLKAEIRRLRGDLRRVAIGGTVILDTASSNPTIPTAVLGSLIRGNATPGWERLAASVPAAGLRNVVGLDNGDTLPAWKALLDSTAPTKVSTDSSAGTSLLAARRDHVHGISIAAHAAITAAGDLITPTAVIMTLTSDADYTLSGTPTIADGVDGQVLILLNVDPTNILTFQDQGTLGSSNLRLAANTVILGPRDSMMLIYSSTVGDWVQIGFMDVL